MPRIARKPAKKNFRRKRPGVKKAVGLPNDAELAAEEAALGEDVDIEELEATGEVVNISELQKKDIIELNEMAREVGIENFGTMRKQDVIFNILRRHATEGGVLLADGVLEILNEGFGFLRSASYNYLHSPEDVYVSPSQIRRFDLQSGDMITGRIRPPKEKEKYFALLKVETVGGEDPDIAKDKTHFDNLTPLFPEERFLLENDPEEMCTRVVDLICPVGKGTRGIIVAPPRTGKTTILKQICNAITTNHKEVKVIVMLIDERPKEVTDFERSVDAEVVASSNDMDLDTHVRLSRFTIERCRRMVECGDNVFVLMDSLTRVSRAFNNVSSGSGRTMSGGVDARALEIPRRMFAAARKIEDGGSLTIIATALIDTGSRMDELIFQEFKGTGNMELVLERKLAERRLFPAIDIPKSGTRKEEKLFPPEHLDAIFKLRRTMVDLNPIEAMETLIGALRKHKTNAELLSKLRV